MKKAFTIGALSLLLFGCGIRDARLQKDVAGYWKRNKYFEMTLSQDGTFVSHWTTTNRDVTYEGTWNIQNDCLNTTITNCIAAGTTNFERVGSVDRLTILQANSANLVVSNSSQIVSFRRE